MSESDKSRATQMALHCQMPKIAFNSLKLVDQPIIDKFSVLLHHCKTVTTLDFTGDIMDDKVKTMVGEMLLGTKMVSSIRLIKADFFSWDERQTAIELPNKALRPPDSALLAGSLNLCRSLNKLDIPGNAGIGDTGILFICRALKDNGTISILDISNTGIGEVGARYMADTFKNEK
jgi:hypothetical protein